MYSNPLNQISGWEGLDLDGEQQQKLKAENVEKAREIASRYKRLFSTEDGEFVLNNLMSTTLLRPVVKPGSTQFEAGIREGQNDIVRQILQQIEIADNL